MKEAGKKRSLLLTVGLVGFLCLCISAPILFVPNVTEQNPTQTGRTDPRDTRENCRLLGIVSTRPPDMDHMTETLKAFGKPSYPQNNGWSLASFSDVTRGGLLAVPGEPMIIRSQIPTIAEVQLFQNAARLSVLLRPTVLLGHLRNASSGCEYLADPHPFTMHLNGKEYLMIHNGGIWGKDLDYLIDNLITGRTLPKSCPDNPIDSEYLFIYLMELIDKNGGAVWESVYEWATNLTDVIESDWNALNILLTDGEIIWGVRMSYRSDRFPLHYNVSKNATMSVISTQALSPDYLPLQNFSLIEIRPGFIPYIEKLPVPGISHEPGFYRLKPPHQQMDQTQ